MISINQRDLKSKTQKFFLSSDRFKKHNIRRFIMESKFKRILYGGDYNPNQWPEEVLEEDMRIFKTPGNGTETGRKDDNAPKTDGGNGAGICNTG